MKKWLAIGGGLLLVAWAPFIYAELTSEPAEKKARELPSDVADDEALAAAEDEHGEQPVGAKAAPAPAEHAADPEEAPAAPVAPAAEPAAEPLVEAPVAAEEPEPAPGEHEDPAEGDEEPEEAEPPPPVASGPAEQLKTAYEVEPRDALWATDTERRIAAVFSQEDVPEGMLQRASCRRAVCSVEVRWRRDHATQYVGAFEALRDQFGTEIGVEPVGTPDDEGQQIVHLYVLRKGYTPDDLAR